MNGPFRAAVMQPYFFPYIGYWQLIHAVQIFVLFDDVQYIRHGWINRNRVLKHGGGWQYLTVPLKKHAKNELIKNVFAHDEIDWKVQILRQLAHYNYKNKAPFYSETVELLNRAFSKITNGNITRINEVIIKEICRHLNIKTQIMVSSEQNFNYGNVQDAGEWALRIAEQMNAQEYINPISGANIFDLDKFKAIKIKLSFLRSDEIRYAQGPVFEPSLSIVDVLMFNGQAGTQSLLKNYSIEPTQ